MQRVLFATTLLASGLAFTAAQADPAVAPAAPTKTTAPTKATAPAKTPAKIPAQAPAKVAIAPTPAPRPVIHVRYCGCHVTHAHIAARRTWKRRETVASATHYRGGDDHGVAPSQAWVYRQELAGHGLASADMPFRRGGGGRGAIPSPSAPPAPQAYARNGGAHGGYSSPPYAPAPAQRYAQSGAAQGRNPAPPYAPPPGRAYAPSGAGQGRVQAPPPPSGAYAQSGGGRHETWTWRQGGGAPDCCARGYRYEHREFHEGGGWAGGPHGLGQGGGNQPAWRRAQGGGYEVYGYAGRDANGFLVWADKPR